MSQETQTKKRAIGTKVSEAVFEAIRIEQARRQLSGTQITRKDIHAEWLEEKAKQVLAAA